MPPARGARSGENHAYSVLHYITLLSWRRGRLPGRGALRRLQWLPIQPKRRQCLGAAAIVYAQERQQIAQLLIGKGRERRHAIDIERSMAGGRLRQPTVRKGRAALLDPLDPVFNRDRLRIRQHLAER